MKFHPFAERFPLLDGDEWEAFKASIQEAGGNSVPISFRMVDGVEQGLDGRNRMRACEELNLPLTSECITIADNQVWRFISNRNIHRRHMSAAARRDVISDMRADGQSIRTIAENLGVGKSTVQRELEKSKDEVSHDGTPEPEPQKVKGKDGKTHPAAKQSKSIFCGRCQRTGPVKNCPSCAEERKGQKAQREPGGSNPRKPASKVGKVLFDWKSFQSEYGAILRQVDKLGKAFDCKESTEAEKLRGLLGEFLTGFKALYKSKAKTAAP